MTMSGVQKRTLDPNQGFEKKIVSGVMVEVLVKMQKIPLSISKSDFGKIWPGQLKIPGSIVVSTDES
jgi:hypothetical protein